MFVKTKTAVHEHLGTNTYRGSFDAVVDLAYERLGPGGIFSVVSIADKRLPGDKRYEKFVDSGRNSKYSLVDLDGRAVYVEDKNLLIVNGIEAEIRDGSILFTGLERDSEIRAGDEIDHSSLFCQIKDEKIFSFIVHPFFIGGSGNYFKETKVYKPTKDCLEKSTGMEVVNGEAFLPFPGYFFANRKAIGFYLELYPKFPNIAPVSWGDGHSLYEFAEITTDISKVNFTDGSSYCWEIVYSSMKQGFENLASDHSPRDLTATFFQKARGIAGAVDHALDLAFWRPLAKKLRITTEEDW